MKRVLALSLLTIATVVIVGQMRDATAQEGEKAVMFIRSCEINIGATGVPAWSRKVTDYLRDEMSWDGEVYRRQFSAEQNKITWIARFGSVSEASEFAYDRMPNDAGYQELLAEARASSVPMFRVCEDTVLAPLP